VIATIVTIAIVAAAIGGLSMLSSSHKASAPTTTFPATWDPRVIDMVQFDAKERGLEYDHPVQVVYLPKAEFVKRLNDESKLTAKDRKQIQGEGEALRALGMVQGNFDLLKQTEKLQGETVEAYYDFDKKQIVIPGDTVTLADRVTLAHELTHTLDDQHFDLTKVQKVADAHDTDAVDALVEGDATRVQNDFEAKLSASDRRAYQRSQDSAVSGDDLKGVPKVLALEEGWPYDIGPAFVEVLKKVGGEARVNDAFRSPPVDEEQVIDPITYLDNDKPGAIAMPALPKGATEIDSSKEFGALQWLLVLSERINPHVALQAALGWGADAYRVAREGTHTCVEINYRGETRRDNAQMLTALHQWIAALPKGMASVKSNSDNTLSLHSCDPGSSAKLVTNHFSLGYGLLEFRYGIIEGVVKGGAPPAFATCYADAVTARVGATDLAADRTPAVAENPTLLGQLAAGCRDHPAPLYPSDEIDN